MSRCVVSVSAARGWNMSLHPRGPKWDLKCGACSWTWQARVPSVDNPTFPCPSCGVLNELNVTWS